MRTGSAYPVTVLTADWHLSHAVPAARGETRKQWYDVMFNYVKEVERVAGMNPIFVAGDLLHSWNEPAELINFLLEVFPAPDSSASYRNVFVVPGNHDLPNHSLDQIERSAFCTLVHGGAVEGLYEMGPEGIHLLLGTTFVTAFPCGVPMRPCIERPEGAKDVGVSLAVAHRYVWTGRSPPFPGVSMNDHARSVTQDNKGHDVILTGDNHQPFDFDAMNGVRLFNAGCLIRRRSDERGIEPRVGILYSDGTVQSVKLDTAGDRWRENLDEMESDLKKAGLDPAAFLETVRSLGDVAVNFGDAVERYLAESKTEPAVARRVRQIMEAVRCQS